MKQLTIGFDIDAVIRDFSKSLITQYKKDYPDHDVVPFENWTEWSLSPWFPIGEEIYPYFREKRCFEIYSTAPEVKGMVELVKELSRTHNIIFITAQNNTLQRVYTILWLDSVGLLDYGMVEFSQDKWTNTFINVMIDDKIKTLQDFKKYNPFVLPVVFDAPWNRDNDEFLRVKNPKDIRLLINNYSIFLELGGKTNEFYN